MTYGLDRSLRRPDPAGNQIVAPFADTCKGSRHDVPIRVQRGRNRGMPQPGLDGCGMNSSCDEQTGVSVPQVVKAYVGLLCRRQMPLESPVYVARINGAARAGPKHKIGLRIVTGRVCQHRLHE